MRSSDNITQEIMSVNTDTTGDRRRIRQVHSFFTRHLLEITRNRTALFWSFGFPTLFYLMTITVFIDLDQVPSAVEPAVMGIVAIGYGVFGAVIVCLNAFGQQLADDIEQRRYSAFRALPLSPSADFIGRSCASILMAAIAFCFVLVVSVLTGASYSLSSLSALPIVVGAFLLSSLIWIVLALFIAVIATNGQYVNIISLSIALISYFGTGFNGTAPSSFAGDLSLLNYLPNSLATRVLSYHMVEIDPEPADGAPWEAAGMVPPEMPVGPDYLGLLALYAVVFLTAGLLAMRYSMYKRGAWE